MSTATPPVKPSQAPAAAQPPEEQFWKHYSPHHEFPLSSVTSVALHVVALVLLTLVAAAIATWTSKKEKPLDEEAITLSSGGGGHVRGQGQAPGVGNPNDGAPAPENVDDTPPEQQSPDQPKQDRQALPKAGASPPPSLPEIQDPDAQAMLRDGLQAAQAAGKIKQSVREQLARGLRKPSPGAGEGGPGKEGGKDRGVGPGQGAREGPGKLTPREKRVLRWVMVFDTASGDDYARQLNGLGAFLAYPDPQDPNQYRVIRDLSRRPAASQIEDLSGIQRIYWIDDRPDSVGALAHALGINPKPLHFFAFFPQKLEEELLRMELQYQGRKEDEIFETRFKVQKSAEGYKPVVISQTPAR